MGRYDDFLFEFVMEDMVWYVIPYTYMMAYASEMIYMNDTFLSASFGS